jgi:hypothetical protein
MTTKSTLKSTSSSQQLGMASGAGTDSNQPGSAPPVQPSKKKKVVLNTGGLLHTTLSPPTTAEQEHFSSNKVKVSFSFSLLSSTLVTYIACCCNFKISMYIESNV